MAEVISHIGITFGVLEEPAIKQTAICFWIWMRALDLPALYDGPVCRHAGRRRTGSVRGCESYLVFGPGVCVGQVCVRLRSVHAPVDGDIHPSLAVRRSGDAPGAVRVGGQPCARCPAEFDAGDRGMVGQGNRTWLIGIPFLGVSSQLAVGVASPAVEVAVGADCHSMIAASDNLGVVDVLRWRVDFGWLGICRIPIWPCQLRMAVVSPRV